MSPPGWRRTGPDRSVALEQYRRRAGVYDLELALFEPIRRRAIAWLAPRHGNTVLDVGCGTGLSFAQLRAAVGLEGRIIGIEQCPEMIERARQRVHQQGWDNVTLLCAPVESARLPSHADAALLHFTHDILQSDDALAHVVKHLRPGARVVASGLKWAPPWAVPTNLFVLPAALRSVSSLAGLRQPWHRLERLIGKMDVSSRLAGGGFIARGQVGTSRQTSSSIR